MPTIDYDPSNVALYSPALRPSLFEADTSYSSLQLGAECARLAYAKAEASPDAKAALQQALTRVGFGTPTLFGDAATGTQGFGAFRPDDGLALLAFRGTEPTQAADFATDLQAVSVPWPESAGRVHSGFATALRAVLPKVQSWLTDGCPARRELLICGHSLGAALATLAASVMKPATLVTLGSPRVGDAAFAASLQGVAITRLVDCCDLVTQVPPETVWYTHVGAPTYIDRNGMLPTDPDIADIEDDCNRARVRYIVDHAWKIGNVPVRDLADHAPINYLRAFF